MALPKSGILVKRQSVVGSEGLYCKMFDPPKDGPPTPDALDLLNLPLGVKPNPVPAVMQAAGYKGSLVAPWTEKRSLMHGVSLSTWDAGQPGRPTRLTFFLFADDDLKSPFNSPFYPAPAVRVPRGAIFHGHTDCQGPPPHTIHWHGIEPTPMNDGVGHCSFEVSGSYVYQWQPNFIGTYFYHCHRNTLQHFEYGLFGLMLFNPPDAYFASIAQIVDPEKGTVALNNIPIGHGRPEPAGEGGLPAAPLGRFRTAANLAAFPQFPGFVGGDPIQGVATPDPLGQFQFDPHAFTIPYDVEAQWVLDDRDSVWSDLAPDPFATFPEFGSVPGVNDKFYLRQGASNFFAFNDYNADYWFVTGAAVRAHKGGSATIDTGLVLPPQLNGGISGSRIDIEAGLGDTILVRCLDAAYNSIRITFPLDIVIIEWDGRALGVPPLNRYTRPILVKAGQPFQFSTARRFGAVMRSLTPVNQPAKVEFLDTRGLDVVMTAFIPIHIN